MQTLHGYVIFHKSPKGGALITNAKMRKIVGEIATIDKRFASVIEASELCDIGTSNPERSHFESLVSSVISQQLATAAARTIKERFVLECGKVTPKNVAAMEIEEMRAAGLSGAKSKTIQGLASAALEKRVDFKNLHDLNDEEAEEILNQTKLEQVKDAIQSLIEDGLVEIKEYGEDGEPKYGLTEKGDKLYPKKKN